MNAGTLATDVGVVVTTGNQILATIEDADPAVGVPAEAAGEILTVLGGLVGAALTAWSNASGIPITVDSVLALLPNSAPLPLPPAGT